MEVLKLYYSFDKSTSGSVLTMRLHTAPCLLCMSGVRRTCSVVTMESPISSQWEEPEDPTPEYRNSTIITTTNIIIIKEVWCH